MNEQKPLGYMGHGAANRLSNAGEVEYVHAARHDEGDRAVYLRPDPEADKLRARIRVLEAEKADIAASSVRSRVPTAGAELRRVELSHALGYTDAPHEWPEALSAVRLGRRNETELAERNGKLEAELAKERSDHRVALASLQGARDGGEKLRAELEAEKDPPCNCCAKSRELHAITCPVANALNSADRLLRKWGRVVSIGWLDTPRIMAEQLAEITQELAATKVLLASESRKVGEQATEIDRLCDTIAKQHNSMMAMVRSQHENLTRALGYEHVALLDWDDAISLIAAHTRHIGKIGQPTSIGAAEWLDAHARGWTVSEEPKNQPTCRFRATLWELGYGATAIEAREALARALGWTGSKSATNVQPELDQWRKWRSFLEAYASWRFDGRDYPNMPPHNKRFDAVDDAWQGKRAIPEDPDRSCLTCRHGVNGRNEHGCVKVCPPPERPQWEAIAAKPTGAGAARTHRDGSSGTADAPTRSEPVCGAASGNTTGCDVKSDPPQCCGTCRDWQPDGTTMPDHDQRGELLRGKTTCGVSVHTGHAWGSHCPAYRPRGEIVDSTRRPMPCASCDLPKPAACRGCGGDEPDRCPLPAVGAWRWTRSTARGITPIEWMTTDDNVVSMDVISPTESNRLYSFAVVIDDDRECASGERKTRKGAQRAAERAARHAWKIRNGGSK